MPLLSNYATYFSLVISVSPKPWFPKVRAVGAGLAPTALSFASGVPVAGHFCCHPITSLLCDDHANKLRFHTGRKALHQSQLTNFPVS